MLLPRWHYCSAVRKPGVPWPNQSVRFTLIPLVCSFPSFLLRLWSTHTVICKHIKFPVAVVTYSSGDHSCPTHSILSHSLGRPPYPLQKDTHTTQTHTKGTCWSMQATTWGLFSIKFSAMSHVNFPCCVLVSLLNYLETFLRVPISQQYVWRPPDFFISDTLLTCY